MEATNNSSIISIDELQNHGINAADIVKLRSAGVCSIAVSKKRINQWRFQLTQTVSVIHDKAQYV